MKRWLSMAALSAALLALPVVARAQAQPAEAAGGVEVVNAAFGVITKQPPGFQPTTVVPYTPGTSYGWIMQVQTTKPTVAVREALTLPAKPETWGAPDPNASQHVSADGRTVTSEGERVLTENGLLARFYQVAAGDPKGHYVIKLSIEGGPTRTFEFDVQ
jgi:hypothetical protein